MKKQVVIILIGILSHAYSALATNYYFSGAGNDQNIGTTEGAPFKTITKLNTLILKPGDFILFKRGETFIGQININQSGTSNAYITFDAYGIGPDPIISGAIKVSNWRLSYHTMYVADVPAAPIAATQVFCNKALMTLARYPNKGFLTIESAANTTSLFSKYLTQADGYWAGANIIARKDRWIYENHVIESNTAGTIKVVSPTSYTFKTGYGFFLNNKQNQLDVPKEWFHDVATKKIFFIAPSQVSPNADNVEASLYSYGFNIVRQKYISINNFNITQQAYDGIFISSCNNILIRNNSFSKCYQNGVYTGHTGGSNIQVVNNKFFDIGNNGIALIPATGTIKSNTLKRIALNPGLGGSGDGEYIGILAGPNSYIGYNILDSIGYNGINFQTKDTVVNNYVTNVCLTKDDGASLYCYKSDHAIIQNNVVQNAIGNGDATINTSYTAAHGIYLDDSSSYCTLTNNTVVNGDYGIFIHNSFNNTIYKNVVYNNRKTQLTIQNDKHVAESVLLKENSISENTFYSVNPDQLCLYLWTYKNTVSGFASFNRNYYCNPYSAIIGKTALVPYYPLGTIPKNQCYNLANWSIAFTDMNSKASLATLGAYYSVESISPNLITNSSFNNDKSTWYKWGTSNFALALDAGNLLMANNSLKAVYQSFATNSNGFIASGDFAVTKGSYYRLQFKSNAVKTSNLDFDITQNISPYKSADAGRSFLLQNALSNTEYIFKSKSDIANARIQFYSTIYDSTCWIDDVVLMQVRADTNTSTPCYNSPIFINPGSSNKTITLPGTYKTLDGVDAGATLILPPFSSKILTRAISGIKKGNGSLLDVETFSDKSTGLIISPVPTSVGQSILVDYSGQTEDGNQVDYTVLSQSGLVLKKGSSFFNDIHQIEINTSGLSGGMWYLKLANGANTRTEKFILF